MNELTQQGIAALKAGDRAGALHLLKKALRQDPNDIQAWMWLSGAVDTDQARIDCLRQVLRIDPNNAAAARGLAQLTQSPPVSSAPPPVSSAPPPASPAPPVSPAPTPSSPPASTPAEQLAPAKPPEFQTGGVFPLRRVSAPKVTTDELRRQVEVRTPSGRAIPSQPRPIDLNLDAFRQAAAESPALEPVENTVPENQSAPAADLPPAAPFTTSEIAGPENGTAVPAETPAAGVLARRHRPPAALSYIEEKQVIFRTRPSHVPALLSFWVFFFGALTVHRQLADINFGLAMAISLGIGVILEAVVILMIVVNFRTQYTLTSDGLHLKLIETQGDVVPRSREVVIPIQAIDLAECRQTFLQRLMGIGDLYFEGAIEGRLGHYQLRGIPHCEQRAQQLIYLMKEKRG